MRAAPEKFTAAQDENVGFLLPWRAGEQSNHGCTRHCRLSA